MTVAEWDVGILSAPGKVFPLGTQDISLSFFKYRSRQVVGCLYPRKKSLLPGDHPPGHRLIFADTMLTEKYRRLFYNFFSLGAVQAISSLAQLVVVPHVISKIGVDGYGMVSVAQVLMFFLSVITDYGFNQTATRDIALNRDNRSRLSEIFSATLASKLFLCLVCLIILLMLIAGIPFFRSHTQLYLTAFTFVLGQALMVNWFFLGLEKMQFITYLTLVARLLFALLVFIFIRERGDAHLFLLFLGGGNVVAGLISILWARRMAGLTWKRPSRALVWHELKEGWHYMLSHLSNSSCHYANIFILRIFTGDLVVGFYSIAERVYFSIKQVFAVFSQAVYPKVCILLAENRRQAFSFLRQVYLPFLAMISAGCVFLFIEAKEVIRLFIPDPATSSVLYLRYFCLIAWVVCLNIPATLLLLAMDQKRAYLSVYSAAAVINILANMLLVQYLEAKGTVLAVLITELFITSALSRAIFRLNTRQATTRAGLPDNP